MSEFQSIEKIHQAYREKKISPQELIQKNLEEIKKSDHNAFLTICEERSLDLAAELEQKWKTDGDLIFENMPLFGAPIGIKDALTIDGVRTTAGSKILENYIPPYTSTAVERLEAAGAISIGKLNMDEFAMGASNENSAFGNVKHPTHPGYVPGGSSGGSASAVKAGLCVAALGSDTGGSIRLPASFCGVVGMRPTYGRVSRYGLVAFASSLDQVGPLAHSVQDCASVLRAMVGHDPRDSTSVPIEAGDWTKGLEQEENLEGLKIGVPEEYFAKGVNAEVAAAVESVLKWYESKGAKRFSISLPHTKYAISTYYIVVMSEASSNLARYDGVKFGVRPPELKDAESKYSLDEFYEIVRSQFGPEVKRRIMLGTYALSSGYYDAYYRKACQVRRLIREDFEKAFQKVDCLIAPVSPTTAFKEGEKTKDPLEMYLQDVFTAPSSLAGIPGISLPCGEDSNGLPIGVQILGPHFNDRKILSIANAFEKGSAK